ncbi:hypothetical protein ASPCADRAFT_406626 [Aspergillus carbonarius ITEM 5010]|uniref:Uncharacterized protein n=1 Tax=Aspergillus carbonarius (strain ITEM 5010) TaxID=602072 RepID=A0A1R3RJV9_ASPC5|nr:hypothetical protein ASPCADRAFT_406626 [Aspergillus carbonarius ITEM 5010]
MKSFTLLSHVLAMGSLLGPLVAATPTTPRVIPRTNLFGDLMVVGAHNTSQVQTLYNLMNNTFQLDEDTFGSEARLHSIWFGDDVQTLNDLGFPNTTTIDLGSSQSKRSDTMSIKSVSCVTDAEISSKDYYLLTYAQQIYLTSFVCSYMLDITANFYGLVGMIATNVKCGAKLQTTCNVAFTVAGAEAGVRIGPYMQEWCVTSFDDLFNYCIQQGGVEEILLTASGAKFDVASFAVDTALSCPSGAACTTYVCKGQCNPGNSLPTKK